MSPTERSRRAGDLLFALVLVAALYATASSLLALLGSSAPASATVVPARAAVAH